MKQRRDLKLEKYNISKEKYRELLYFCMQYNEKKSAITYGLSAISNEAGSRTNAVSSPTEAQAIRNEKNRRDVELIERAAAETDKIIKEAIIKSVTEGIEYIYLNVPMGRRQFYEKRRLFFKILSEMR